MKVGLILCKCFNTYPNSVSVLISFVFSLWIINDFEIITSSINQSIENYQWTMHSFTSSLVIKDSHKERYMLHPPFFLSWVQHRFSGNHVIPYLIARGRIVNAFFLVIFDCLIHWTPRTFWCTFWWTFWWTFWSSFLLGTTFCFTKTMNEVVWNFQTNNYRVAFNMRASHEFTLGLLHLCMVRTSW